MSRKKSGADYSMQSVKDAQKNYYENTKKQGLTQINIKRVDSELKKQFSGICEDRNLTYAEGLKFLCDYYDLDLWKADIN